ncbi:MAG TPA: ACP S-malonyltransferase [Thermoanaerobaculia bacterium]|nr:ACP S-malonyltransferase [Thermoanaerobaculia bacterium]
MNAARISGEGHAFHGATFGALFPGQLSEKPGMGEAFARRYDFVSSLFEEISSRSGVRLAETFFGEGLPSLHDDKPAQVGVFAVSLAALEVLRREHGLVPDACCGYSLGTYAAFVAAGCLSREAALDALLEAERLLAEERAGGEADGTMGFVIGLGRADVEAALAGVCPDLSRLAIATENAAAQFVLTGERDLVEEALDLMRPRALKAEMLTIGFPMHSRSLESVSEKLKIFLEGGVRVGQPQSPLFAPMLGRRVGSSAEAAHVLSEQISLPSFFSPTLLAMRAAGIHRFAEVGPGDVLTKLVRWTLRDAIVARPSLERPEDVHVFAATVLPAGPRAVPAPVIP